MWKITTRKLAEDNLVYWEISRDNKVVFGFYAEIEKKINKKSAKYLVSLLTYNLRMYVR